MKGEPMIVGQQCIVRGQGGQEYLGVVMSLEPSGIRVRGGPHGESVYAPHNVELINPRAASNKLLAELREKCASACEDACPQGGRAWTSEQSACFAALTHVAEFIRSIELPGELPRGPKV